MGAFVISKRFDDMYKFVFTSKKGKVIFTSMPYELKFECEEAIEMFKKKLEIACFIKEKSTSGKYFFKIFINETHFASSRKYSTELRLEKGITEIILQSANAEILDFSNSDFVFL